MIKADNIATKEFRKSLYGYDCEQVDLFLDEIIVQLKQMEQERLEMATTIEYLVSKLSGDPLGTTEKEEVVAPVSPHQLLSNTGRQKLVSAENEADAHEKIDEEPSDSSSDPIAI